MKIVYCIAGTFNSGGMERVLANKANYLAAHGHEVGIITTDQRGRKPFFFLDERVHCYDLNVNYNSNNGKSFFNKLFRYPFKHIKHKNVLASLLNELKAEIVVSMFCNDFSFITGINDGSRKILEAHFSKFKRLQYERKGLWRLADVYRNLMDEKRVIKFDRFVVLTREDKIYWGDLPNITVIPNAITCMPEEIAALDNKKAIAVGRYTYQKGFDYLIDVWGLVHQIQPDWELDIIGDGELREQLQMQINKNGLQQSVHLIPPTPNIYYNYSQASIMVMSSRYEGLPMVLLEASAFGLPIVSFACKCGPGDIVAHGDNGFLILQGNIKKMADKLCLLMKDDKRRKQMGTAARKKALDFTEEAVMDKWTKLFEQLVNNK